MNELFHPTLAFEPFLMTLLYFFLGVIATVKVLRYRNGLAAVVWLILIWIPWYFGAILAILFVRRITAAAPRET